MIPEHKSEKNTMCNNMHRTCELVDHLQHADCMSFVDHLQLATLQTFSSADIVVDMFETITVALNSICFFTWLYGAIITLACPKFTGLARVSLYSKVCTQQCALNSFYPRKGWSPAKQEKCNV